MDDFEESIPNVEQDEPSALGEAKGIAEDAKSIYKDGKDIYGKVKNRASKNVKDKAAKETGKKAVKETGKQAAKETGKQAAKTAGKQAAKQGAKIAAKTAAKAALGAATGGIATAVDVGIQVAKFAGKKIKDKLGIEEDSKDVKKIKKLLPLLLILCILLFPMMLISLTLSIGYEVTTNDSVDRLDQYISCFETAGGCIDHDGAGTEYGGYYGFNNENAVRTLGENNISKDLVRFDYAEIRELAEKYSLMSNTHYEYGEGYEFLGPDDAYEAFNIKYDVTKQDFDDGIIANFLTLKARAFSKVKWRVWLKKEDYAEKKLDDYYDDKYQEVILRSDDCTENKKETWYVFYLEEKDLYDFKIDTTGDLNEWSKWFGEDEYKIRIPDPTKFATVISTATKHYVAETGEKTIEGISEVSTETSYDTPEVALNKYLTLLVDYLPQWVEPYAIYMSAGDPRYAAIYYKECLKFINGDKFQLVVDLFNADTTSESTTEMDGKSSGLTYTSEINNRCNINQYQAVVNSGFRYDSFLEQKGEFTDTTQELIDKAKLMEVYDNSENVSWQTPKTTYSGVKQTHLRYSLVDAFWGYGYLTASEEINMKNSICWGFWPFDKEKSYGYPFLLGIDENDPLYSNKYMNTRVGYFHYNILADLGSTFTFNMISDAFKPIEEFYKAKKNKNVYENATASASSNGGNGR